MPRICERAVLSNNNKKVCTFAQSVLKNPEKTRNYLVYTFFRIEPLLQKKRPIAKHWQINLHIKLQSNILI